MSSVGEVLSRYGPSYLQTYHRQMTAQQKKVLRAASLCRSKALGTIDYACAVCGKRQTVPRGCCNRHCPVCQHQRQQAWLSQQTTWLLPCHYFLITFTLPKPMRPIAMHHPDVVYRALMQAASWSLKQGAKSERFVGVPETGFTGVLHTWGRDLSYHPHAHFLVPGGGVDAAGRWTSSRASLFVAEQVLERLFKKKLRALLQAAELPVEIPAAVWQGRFVVDSQAVGGGEHALKYLAPYVNRGPVANWRITACDVAGDVGAARLTLQVKRSGTRQYRPTDMTVAEFIRRWLQHVLPSGLHRVRHYGFFSSSSRRSPEELKLLVAAALGKLHYLACTEQIVMASPAAMQCLWCGGPMLCLGYTPPPTYPYQPAATNVTQPARAPP